MGRFEPFDACVNFCIQLALVLAVDLDFLEIRNAVTFRDLGDIFNFFDPCDDVRSIAQIGQ
jgi:hypothetical protein